MKHLLLLTAALAGLSVAAPLGVAAARDGGQDRRVERQNGGEARDREERRSRRRPDSRSDGGPVRSFAPSAPRRGGVSPEGFLGEVVRDYPRYRLRTPPQGYAWVRMGDGFALVSLDDGRIYDRVR